MEKEKKIKELEKRVKELNKELKNIKEDESQIKEDIQEVSKSSESDISRRSFLKKLGAGAAGIGALSLLPASAVNIRTSNALKYFGNNQTSPNFSVQPDGSLESSSVIADKVEALDELKLPQDPSSTNNQQLWVEKTEKYSRLKVRLGDTTHNLKEVYIGDVPLSGTIEDWSGSWSSKWETSGNAQLVSGWSTSGSNSMRLYWDGGGYAPGFRTVDGEWNLDKLPRRGSIWAYEYKQTNSYDDGWKGSDEVTTLFALQNRWSNIGGNLDGSGSCYGFEHDRYNQDIRLFKVKNEDKTVKATKPFSVSSGTHLRFIIDFGYTTTDTIEVEVLNMDNGGSTICTLSMTDSEFDKGHLQFEAMDGSSGSANYYNTDNIRWAADQYG